MKLKKFINYFLIIMVLYIVVCLIILPQNCTDAVSESLKLCVNGVIPTLFPFFVCSSLFVNLGLGRFASKYLSGIMKPLFHVDGSGAVAVVLGIVSGYPVGAKCAVDLYKSKRISKNEAERLIGFCNNSGPLFVIGTVGFVMNKSVELGGVLYIIHALGAILTGLIISRFYQSNSKEYKSSEMVTSDKNISKTVNIGEVFGTAITDSVMTILKVCGFVIFFAVVQSTLPTFSGSKFIYPLLEITGGISGVSAMVMNAPLKFALISMFLAFSGISVLLQVSSIITPFNLSSKFYIIGKLVHGMITFIITFVTIMFLQNTGVFQSMFPQEQVFSYSQYDYSFFSPRIYFENLLAQIAFSCIWTALVLVLMGVFWIISDKVEQYKAKKSNNKKCLVNR